jgi:hypothetical protein
LPFGVTGPNRALGENVTVSLDLGLPNWSVTVAVTVLFEEPSAGMELGETCKTMGLAGGPGVWVKTAVAGVRPVSVAVIVTGPAVVEAWIVAL